MLAALEPWLETSGPNEAGEWGMYCSFPTHGDNKRSATVNFDKGVFNCFVCGGGAIDDLMDHIQYGNPTAPQEGGNRSRTTNGKVSGPMAELSDAEVAGWHSALMSNKERLDELVDQRGLNRVTIEQHEIGWIGGKHQLYSIPVRDIEGTLINVRQYTLHPGEERSKIWSVAGRGRPVLYPCTVFPLKPVVIICEGEMDCLLTRQQGFEAVTRTGAAKVWRAEWNNYFQDKVVYLCHDMDKIGQNANRIVAAHLQSVVSELYVMQLPYEITDKHGKDLTDYWMEGNTAHDFMLLMAEAESWGRLADSNIVKDETHPVSVMASFDANNVGRRMRMPVTITGKRPTPFVTPHQVQYLCTQDAGAKCLVCPMNEQGFGGVTEQTIDYEDPLVLELIDTTTAKRDDLLRQQVTPVKCGRLQIKITESMSVEVLFARSSVDMTSEDKEYEKLVTGEYANRQIIAVNSHEGKPNTTVEVEGTVYPDPRSQLNQFQAWSLKEMQTSVDLFEMTPDLYKAMKIFQPRAGQRPLHKLEDIADDVAAHVTKIYGRPELHMFMDLVFHSLLRFPFFGTIEEKGWLDALVYGDTRTGKSEAAKKLMRFYGAGEFVGCESATFAGVVGGLQQMGGKDWFVTWGAIPLNDRRMVTLDEVAGLTHEQIAQMSSIRSSGEAQLVKIRAERTAARTRLLWMANPRKGQVSDHTYGVQGLLPLIGNYEDVARFDMAMVVKSTEVRSATMNEERTFGPQRYDKAACAALVHWTWSRKVEHVRWAEGAEGLVLKRAIDLAERYTDQPPLIQAANVRFKIARIAVALAARTFSTDDTGELLIVRKVHVLDAADWLDRLYGMPAMGYRKFSEEKLSHQSGAVENYDEVKSLLVEHPNLSTFLRSNDTFKNQALVQTLGYSVQSADRIVSQLYAFNMLRRDRDFNRVNKELHPILLTTEVP